MFKGQVQIRCDNLVKKKNYCILHVFMYFLKHNTLYFMENRLFFAEIKG